VVAEITKAREGKGKKKKEVDGPKRKKDEGEPRTSEPTRQDQGYACDRRCVEVE
jgi:hypothetical protein